MMFSFALFLYCLYSFSDVVKCTVEWDCRTLAIIGGCFWREEEIGKGRLAGIASMVDIELKDIQNIASDSDYLPKSYAIQINPVQSLELTLYASTTIQSEVGICAKQRRITTT